MSPKNPRLRFTPTAWAKLLYLRDYGPTEVGCFGIATTEDPLLVTDLHLVEQFCSMVTVSFDNRAVADFFDEQVDLGLRPTQFARIWIHTHPGNSPEPSSIDERTFARVFGQTDWAVMFILARKARTYCRLQFHIGPGGTAELMDEVDYHQPFAGSDQTSWEAEYRSKVRPLPEQWPDLEPAMTSSLAPAKAESDQGRGAKNYDDPWDDMEDLYDF